MTLSRSVFLFPVLFAFGIMPVAQAQVTGLMTALHLQQLCTSPYDVDTGLCAGYVTALAEKMMQQPTAMPRICLSPAIGPDTLVRNLHQAWGEQAPAAHELAVDHVEAVLRARFRCP